MLLLQYTRAMACLWIWLLGVWCGCGASYASVHMLVGLHTLFTNVMTYSFRWGSSMAWCGVLLVFPFGSFGAAMCVNFSCVSGLLCSGLLLSGQETWESLALGSMVQFWIVFFAFLVAFVKFIWQCLQLNDSIN